MRRWERTLKNLAQKLKKGFRAEKNKICISNTKPQNNRNVNNFQPTTTNYASKFKFTAINQLPPPETYDPGEKTLISQLSAANRR